jgi:hypothetical protein
MITKQKTCELDGSLRLELESRGQTEFGHIPLVANTQWAAPDWTVICYANDEIASFCHVVEREVSVDGSPVKVGGLNNVIASPRHRGKGHTSRMLREVRPFILETLKCQLGLLLCADELVPFYKRLQWYQTDCPAYYQQKSGEHLWTGNTMLLSDQEPIAPQRIHLNGLPW